MNSTTPEYLVVVCSILNIMNVEITETSRFSSLTSHLTLAYIEDMCVYSHTLTPHSVPIHRVIDDERFTLYVK